MTDEELARFIHRIDHYFNYEEYIWVVRFEDVEIEDNQINILEWLQSKIKPEFEQEKVINGWYYIINFVYY